MSAKKQAASSVLSAIRFCSLLALIYVVAIFILPYDRGTAGSYHLTLLEYRIVELVVNLPFIVVWFFAFWGYTKLKQYASYISKTKEGKQFDRLATGSAVLAWSLPITAIVGRILNAVSAEHNSFHSAYIIMYNYCELILPFIAFLIIGSAANGILGKRKNQELSTSPTIMSIFAVGGIVYCFLMLKALDPASLGSTSNPYYLPAWLIVISLMIPYLYAWFIGLLACYQITMYARVIKGVLYKRALYYLVGGLVAIILSFIATQYLDTVWPTPGHVLFNYRLVILIIFKIIEGVGFVLMAVGANRLKKIEEV